MGMPLVGSRKTIPQDSSPSVSRKDETDALRLSLFDILIRHFVDPSGSTLLIFSMSFPVAVWNFSKIVPNVRRVLLFVPVLHHVRHECRAFSSVSCRFFISDPSLLFKINPIILERVLVARLRKLISPVMDAYLGTPSRIFACSKAEKGRHTDNRLWLS